MKKTYIKPEIEVVELETESSILVGSDFTPESGDGYGGNEAGTNRYRRGTWGNLWAEQ